MSLATRYTTNVLARLGIHELGSGKAATLDGQRQ